MNIECIIQIIGEDVTFLMAKGLFPVGKGKTKDKQ
jgi:hypothetical protein